MSIQITYSKAKDFALVEYNEMLTPCEKTDIQNYLKCSVKTLQTVSFKKIGGYKK